MKINLENKTKYLVGEKNMVWFRATFSFCSSTGNRRVLGHEMCAEGAKLSVVLK